MIPNHRRRPTTRIGQTIDKLMGGHLLDRQIDGIDFLPFLTTLVAAGLLTAGLFGDGNLSNLNLFGNLGGLNNGNLIIRSNDVLHERPKRSIPGNKRKIPDDEDRFVHGSNFDYL